MATSHYLSQCWPQTAQYIQRWNFTQTRNSEKTTIPRPNWPALGVFCELFGENILDILEACCNRKNWTYQLDKKIVRLLVPFDLHCQQSVSNGCQSNVVIIIVGTEGCQYDNPSSDDTVVFHDDIINWKLFPCYWPFVWGIHRSPVNSPHRGQWCGALMFSLICAEQTVE